MHPEALIYFTSDHSPDAPGIYLYGLCMAVGIVLCFVFLLFTMWKRKFNEAAADKILIIGIVGTGFGIFAAMLFQSVYNFIANPSGGFHLGGMTFIGGLIGGTISFLGLYFLYIYVIAPRAKVKFLQNNMNATLSDALPFIPIAICIAHAFGRLGCFFAGCCYGIETDSWIGIACASSGGHTLPQTVVPTQLFEMSFLVILAVAMAVLYFKFNFNYNFALYLFGYGVWRFLIEFIRGDARGEFIGSALSPSQIWSVLMIIGGIGYIFLQRYVIEKHMKTPWRSAAAPDAAPEATEEVENTEA